jgi:hypothetical protein
VRVRLGESSELWRLHYRDAVQFHDTPPNGLNHIIPG